MPQYKIRDIIVEFPFPAYDCQLAYMEKVIQSLQEQKHALLESPTGTGKTLCLLCATLAWRRHLQQQVQQQQIRIQAGELPPNVEEIAVPQIFYLSRTHTQIKKVISELKRTAYADVRTSLLGARSQLCIHPGVNFHKGTQLNNACRAIVARRSCNFYENVEEGLGNPKLTDQVMDIEDLVKVAKEHATCPYYLSREMHHQADVVFLPYNYVIDAVARRSMSLKLQGSILLFDEAHNLETICEESSSFDLTASELREAAKELDTCALKIKTSLSRGEGPDALPRFNADEGPHTRNGDAENTTGGNPLDPDHFVKTCHTLKDGLKLLEQKILSLRVDTFKGSFLLQLLSECMHLTEQNFPEACAVLDQAAQLLADSDSKNEVVVVQRGKSNPACQNVSEALRIAFASGSSRKPIDLADYYKTHIHMSKTGSGFQAKEERTLSYWCMSGGVCMESLVNDLHVRTIVLTSGTLSPLNQLAAELQIPFPIRLENPHIIGAQQIWVGAMAKSPNGILLNSSFKNRERDDYKHELGNTLVNLTKILPGGVLVFFPSYTVMDHCINYWKSQGSSGPSANHPVTKQSADPTKQTPKSATIWERLSKNKQLIFEPRDSNHCNNAITDFVSKVRDKRSSGAVFFAVCRGKVSEGLDFADDLGRAVIVTGLPYPAVNDDRVVQKRLYLDEALTRAKSSTATTALLKKEDEPLSGNDWYNTQAWRAVNQAVGRVIRHRLDYAAVLLLDERFTSKNAQDQLSGWMRKFTRVYTGLGEALLSLTRFFKAAPDHIKDVAMQAQLPLPDPLPPTPTIQPNAVASAAAPQAPQQRLITREGKSESAPTAKESTGADVTTYMKSVKATLSAEDHKTFQRIISGYKNRKLDIENLVHQIRLLMSRGMRPEYLKLMKEFVEFIPKQQRESYRQLLLTPVLDLPITPLKPQPAEHAIAHANADSAKQPEAPASPTLARKPSVENTLKRRTSPPPDEPVALVVNSSSGKVDLVSGANTPKGTGVRPSAASPTTPYLPIPKKPKPNPSGAAPADAAEAPSSMDTFEAVIQQHALLTREASNGAKAHEPKPVAVPPAPAAAPPPVAAKPPASKSVVCPICQDTFKEPAVSPCGHVCCYPCWTDLLQTKLECPLCRAKVRLKNVRRVYLE